MRRFLAACAALAVLALALPVRAQTPVTVDGRVALASLVSLAENHLRTVLDSLETLAATPAARSGDWNAVSAPLATVARITVPGAFFYAKPDGTYWTTASGRQRVTIADRAYFKEALSGRTVVGELVVSRSTGKPAAVVAVPVRDARGAVVAVLGGSIFLEPLSALLVKEMDLAPGAAFFAVDPHLVIALHSDASNILMEPSKMSPQLDAVGRTMLANPSGVQTYEYRGKRRTMLFTRSAFVGWRFGFGIVHS